MLNQSLNTSEVAPFDNETSLLQVSPGIVNMILLLIGSVQVPVL